MVREFSFFGSINIYRYDYQFGWGTDQFPNNIPEITLAHYEVLRASSFIAGRRNFDLKLRRQSLDAEDFILAHVDGKKACAVVLWRRC